MNIAIDTMSGDNGLSVTIPAVFHVLIDNPNTNFVLVGDSIKITKTFSELNLDIIRKNNVEIINCRTFEEENIEFNAFYKQLKQGKINSSMSKTIELVASKKVDACVTAGSTKALMALTNNYIQTIHDIKRPALISMLPTFNSKKSWMIDLGANFSSNARKLYQFALMAITLIETKKKGTVSVGILNLGKECKSGPTYIQEAANLIKKITNIEFYGFIEGNEIYDGKVDLIVCDGFVGNIVLKSSEGLARQFLKNAIYDDKQPFFKRLIANYLFRKVRSFNPDYYNGAIMLGLKNVIVKSHGSANEEAFRNAIIETMSEVQQNIPQKIETRLKLKQL